jgi:hypothetical protein
MGDLNPASALGGHHASHQPNGHKRPQCTSQNNMRLSSTPVLFVCALSTHFSLAHKEKPKTCRNVPGSAGYPKAAAWSKLNATIGGRLVNVVPTAKYCARLPGGACTDAQWTSAVFRSTIPGSMTKVCSSITQTLSSGSLRRGCEEQLGAGAFLPLIYVAQILINV